MFEFTPRLANVTSEDFVREWLGDAGGVVTGENFAFGRARAGGVAMLRDFSGRRGVTVDAVDAITLLDETVSSSRIRDASIRLGDYLRPRRGVYAVRVRLADRVLGGSAYLEDTDYAGPEQLLELFRVDNRGTRSGPAGRGRAGRASARRARNLRHAATARPDRTRPTRRHRDCGGERLATSPVEQ